MSDDIKKIKGQLIKAGKAAAIELVKVAEKKLIIEGDMDELAADKLKNAATAKKMAIFDAFEILEKIKTEEAALNNDDADPDIEAVSDPKKLDFLSAEERA